MRKYENLFQIGEVASLFNISRKMLLNYESHGLIIPTLIDPDTNYRYFDSYTIARIQLILDLRQTGMSVSDIGKYLRGELSTKTQLSLLEKKIFNAKKAIEQLELRNVSESDPFCVKEVFIPKRYCIKREFISKDINDAISAVFNTYNECIERKLKFSESGYHFCEFTKNIFDDDFYELTDISMNVCIAIDEKNAPIDAVVYPQTKALSVSFYGDYTKGYYAYELLKKYILENNYSVTGFPQETYLEGNFEDNQDKRITWIFVPVG